MKIVNISSLHLSLNIFFLDENGIISWKKLPWDNYLEILQYLNWSDRLKFLDTHSHITDRILTQFRPHTLEIKDKLKYAEYKQVISIFGIYFHTVILHERDFQPIDGTYGCGGIHQLPFRYIKNLQKYCQNVKKLSLNNISIGFLGFKKKWNLIENLTEITIKNTLALREDINPILKHLKNLETFHLENIKMRAGWSKELNCPNLKRFILINTVSQTFDNSIQIYADCQEFFRKHTKIEVWYCDQPMYRAHRDKLRLGKIREITLAIYQGEAGMEWAYLKDLSSVKKIKIITHDLEITEKLIRKIITNRSLNEIEIYEEPDFNEEGTFNKQHEHDKITKLNNRSNLKIILNTRYMRSINNKNK